MDVKIKLMIAKFVVGLTIFIGFVSFTFWLSIRNDNDNWKVEYPEVADSTEIHAFVKLILCPPKTRCGGTGNLLTLSDGTKYRFYPQYNAETQLHFFEVIARGDSISKLNGVDSIYVCKNDEKLMYKFGLKTIP